MTRAGFLSGYYLLVSLQVLVAVLAASWTFILDLSQSYQPFLKDRSLFFNTRALSFHIENIPTKKAEKSAQMSCCSCGWFWPACWGSRALSKDTWDAKFVSESYSTVFQK